MIIAKPCTTMRGLVIQPYSWDREVKVDLGKTAECLGKKGVEVKKLIPKMMLIVEMEGYELSVYPSGKIIIKLLDDMEMGKKISREVFDCAGILEVVEG
ncbi:hypothetical protein [Palaeococcus ferrophilus]|uniref:hypothetical protein n=1 Tax=Palaeococcus ferrophilus TaxID=83868 RepID=UPI00064EEB63|nr:hypothetical protein [Palaeococcus ferrophilus]